MAVCLCVQFEYDEQQEVNVSFHIKDRDTERKIDSTLTGWYFTNTDTSQSHINQDKVWKCSYHAVFSVTFTHFKFTSSCIMIISLTSLLHLLLHLALLFLPLSPQQSYCIAAQWEERTAACVNMPTPSTSVFGAPPHTAAFTGNSAVHRSQRSAPTQKSLMWVIKTQSHDLWHVGRKHCWNFFMDRIGSMFGSLTGLNEWNVCAVTFTLCKTMAVRFTYPSIHLLLFIRCGSRLQQDKQDRLLQMFSPHPASFYVKGLQPYSEAPPDIWAL